MAQSCGSPVLKRNSSQHSIHLASDFKILPPRFSSSQTHPQQLYSSVYKQRESVAESVKSNSTSAGPHYTTMPTHSPEAINTFFVNGTKETLLLTCISQFNLNSVLMYGHFLTLQIFVNFLPPHVSHKLGTYLF